MKVPENQTGDTRHMTFFSMPDVRTPISLFYIMINFVNYSMPRSTGLN